MKFINKAFLVSLMFFSSAIYANTGTLGSYIKTYDESLKEQKKSVMVTLFQNRIAIAQRESDLSSYVSFSKLKPGEYDIRFEGEGLEMQNKYGVVVFAKKTTDLRTIIVKGTGVKSIYYSTHNANKFNDVKLVDSKIRELKKELKELIKIREIIK